MCIACGAPDAVLNNNSADLLSDSWSADGFVQQQYGHEITVHVDKASLGKHAYRYTKNLIEEIDDVTAITVRRVGDPQYADIKVYKVDNYTGELASRNDVANGIAFVDDDGIAHATYHSRAHEINSINITNHKGKRKSRKFVSYMTKRVIAHELLHTLGLGHPNGDGLDPAFDGSKTTMSYNHKALWTGLTDMDTQALQSVWG